MMFNICWLFCFLLFLSFCFSNGSGSGSGSDSDSDSDSNKIIYQDSRYIIGGFYVLGQTIAYPYPIDRCVQKGAAPSTWSIYNCSSNGMMVTEYKYTDNICSSSVTDRIVYNTNNATFNCQGSDNFMGIQLFVDECNDMVSDVLTVTGVCYNTGNKDTNNNKDVYAINTCTSHDGGIYYFTENTCTDFNQLTLRLNTTYSTCTFFQEQFSTVVSSIMTGCYVNFTGSLTRVPINRKECSYWMLYNKTKIDDYSKYSIPNIPLAVNACVISEPKSSPGSEIYMMDCDRSPILVHHTTYSNRNCTIDKAEESATTVEPLSSTTTASTTTTLYVEGEIDSQTGLKNIMYCGIDASKCTFSQDYSLFRVYDNVPSCESFPTIAENNRYYKDYVVLTDQCLQIDTNTSMINTCDKTKSGLIVYTYAGKFCEGDPIQSQNYQGCKSTGTGEYYYYSLLQCNTNSLFTTDESTDDVFPLWVIPIIIILVIICAICSYCFAKTSRQMGECMPDNSPIETFDMTREELSRSQNTTDNDTLVS